MVFAEFQGWSTGWNGKDFSGPRTMIPICGSDGTFRCDNRKSLVNQIAEARKRAEALQNVVSGIVGLRMFRSPSWRLTEGKPITEILPIGETFPEPPAL